MSAPTKSYYIDINRYSAQDNESDQTNIWDYSLNDTIVAPSGSEVSIHQAFLNQKGITGQSIEFEEDIVETIFYYAYITESEQAVPVLQAPVSTTRAHTLRVNNQDWSYLNLLNNAASGATSGRGKGRYGLWGIKSTLTEGTVLHLDSLKFGGSGAPLILSDPPEPDSNTEFEVNVAITPPNSLAGSLTLTPVQSGLNKFIATEDTVNKLIYQQGQLRGITGNRIHFENPSFPVADNFTKTYGSNSHLEIDTLDIVIGSPTYGHGTFSQPWVVGAGGANSIQAYKVNVFNAWGDGSAGGTASETGNIFQRGRIDLKQLGYNIDPPTSTREIKVGMRVYDKVGNSTIPMGCRVHSISGDGNGIFISNQAGTLVQFGINGGGSAETRVKTNVPVYFNSDTNYYCSPRPLSAKIKVPKGVYGIQQLISLINNQLSGTAAADSKVPQTPYNSGLNTNNWDGMINQGTQGFTTKITPIQYRDSPDTIHLEEINPEQKAAFGTTIPDHTFISAFDYSLNRANTQSLNDKNRVNFTTKIAGTGYIGYLMDNNVQGVSFLNGLDLDLLPPAFGTDGFKRGDISTAADCLDDNQVSKNSGAKAQSDYQIGRKDYTSITIGAPEANIQFDTDTSSFSINNLHASWRIPSHDILGEPITNKGEVGVGLKRCAEICDAQPFSQFQKIWGAVGRNNLTASATATTQLRGKCVANTNILEKIRFQDNAGNVKAMSFMTIGAKLRPVSLAPHPNSHDKLPEPAGQDFVEIIEIIPAETGGTPDPSAADSFFSVRLKFPQSWNSGKQEFKAGFDDPEINFTVESQMSATVEEQQQMITSFQRPKSRIGGAIVFNFAQATALKYGDRPSVSTDPVYSQHASYSEFFSSKTQAKKIWKTKTIWGKLGFSYEQFNTTDYFENIIQYCQPKTYKLRGITTDTVLDSSTIPSISSIANPSDFNISGLYGGAPIKNPQVFNNFDINTPRTELQRTYGNATAAEMPKSGNNQASYAGSIHTMTTMVNVVAKPTPVLAEGLPTLSKFGYYLITSDLVPTYKDIVSKGDPLGLLGVVAKTSLSSQDFIPLANSDIVQVLNQDTQINNIRVKILNPDLTNPTLNENSSVILRIDVPIQQPTPNTEQDTKTPKKKCPKTGHKICKCPPTSIEKIAKK